MRLKNAASTDTRLNQPPHGAFLTHDVVAEHAHAAAVGQQQGRQDTHEGRLARAVLAEHGHALASGDRERDAAQRRGADAPAPFAAGELLVEIDDFNCRHDMLLTKTALPGQGPATEAALGSAGGPSGRCGATRPGPYHAVRG